MTSKLTVWFDGTCPLCIREIALMRRLDRRGAIDFIDIGSEETGAVCPLDRAERLARFHARDAEGRLLSGAAAFAAMWRVIPLLSPLGQLARLPPVLWVLERFYRMFLRLRPWLQSLARRLAKAPPQKAEAAKAPLVRGRKASWTSQDD